MGRAFDEEALLQVQRWRQQRVDARFIQIDARQSQQTGRWLLHVRRERYPQRTELLETLFDAVGDMDRTERQKLAIKLYSTSAPSTESGKKDGRPRRRHAHAVLTDLNTHEETGRWPEE